MRLEPAQGRRLAARVCAMACLSLVAGCTLEPRYRAPALPVPDQWPIPATTASDTAMIIVGQDELLVMLIPPLRFGVRSNVQARPRRRELPINIHPRRR